MAYMKGNPYRESVQDVACDNCAENGVVPFKDDKYGIPWQERPWCWAPTWGGACRHCNADC